MAAANGLHYDQVIWGAGTGPCNNLALDATAPPHAATNSNAAHTLGCMLQCLTG